MAILDAHSFHLFRNRLGRLYYPAGQSIDLTELNRTVLDLVQKSSNTNVLAVLAFGSAIVSQTNKDYDFLVVCDNEFWPEEEDEVHDFGFCTWLKEEPARFHIGVLGQWQLARSIHIRKDVGVIAACTKGVPIVLDAQMKQCLTGWGITTLKKRKVRAAAEWDREEGMLDIFIR